MIDFIEYVVAELKSKRLSRANAAALVRQFSRRSSGSPSPGSIHPLLHRNTSDLSEQRFSSTFDGAEFFLADHQVRTHRGDSHKLLPGVVYLEMARAAIEHALPGDSAGMVLELRNSVWAQPVVVAAEKELSVALVETDDEQIEFAICTRDGGDEIVHCQGRAAIAAQSPPQKLDIARLEARMAHGRLDAATVYDRCERMGLLYGPSFRAVTAIALGENELLATLRLPDDARETATAYVLHPSVMDGALQACVGLIDNPSAEPAQPRLPFALEALRVIAPCTPEMVAWVRYAPGSSATESIVRVDIDLCDEAGNVRVELRGFTSRLAESDIGATAAPAGRLLARPVWEADGAGASGDARDPLFAERHVIVCELPQVSGDVAGPLVSRSRWLSLDAGEERTIPDRYRDHALACFDLVQSIFREKPHGEVLVQIVVPDDGERALFAGLSALLRTAALENPRLVGQVVVVPPTVSSAELAHYVDDATRGAIEPLCRYRDAGRQVLRWREIEPAPEQQPIAFRDDGVYLITGGVGRLGLLFANEILARTRAARVILTGRSPLDARRRALLDELPERAIYRQLDLVAPAEVKRLVAEVERDHGRLTGVLHCAGTVADEFILKKHVDDFAIVLAPKVAGTWNLDRATRDVALDFFVLFSAIGGATGNVGQADYATANAFMDQFAAYRNHLVAEKQRHGRTRSINWPLWRDGGLGVDAATQERLHALTGMQPMESAAGIDAFHRILAMPYDQAMVVEGDVARMRRTLLAGAMVRADVARADAAATASSDAASLSEKTEELLRRELSAILKVPAHEIDPRAALENYGIDSILAMKLTSRLETTFGSLPKTLFFEYQTIRDLAAYFVADHAARLSALFDPAADRGGDAAQPAPAMRPASSEQPTAPNRLVSSRRFSRRRSGADVPRAHDEPIAIIGLSGRYPEAIDVAAYWANLRDGKDCIVEIPKERWDWREYYTEDRGQTGRHYSKWGGFIAGVDEFDPLFFNISPVDAELMDPQERLFLQHAWMAVEDAGYTRASLQVPCDNDLPGQVGVYAGVMYTEYQLFGAEATARGKRLGVVGSFASVANRVSYALNLHGPSMTLDTMCSSSLSAIHVACQDLRSGRTSLAIAGGVNVTIHPNKYLILSDGQFISSDGHCQSFGEGGDGYIPGEGVGVVVLKRLSEAERDGDHIYGVIRGSALNHGGKTNGYSVPNPQAQAAAISRALAESRVDARHISYVEAHGTGTKLGDPIEIAALNKAFQQYTRDTRFCLIGSAKSNVGHCESAAGIAGLTKVLLQMQHRQIAPSLHSVQLNPHIDFEASPFIVNQDLTPWEPPVVDGRTLPRIAGISSFGAGGSNAHLVVEEYRAPVRQPVAFANVAILLSARTVEQLEQKARDLLLFMRSAGDADLVSIAFTLQVGREAMDERLALIVSSTAELVEKLDAFVGGRGDVTDLYRGRVARRNDVLSLLGDDADIRQAIDRWIASRKLPKLLDLWVRGLDVDWMRLYGDATPRRVSLPAYPFARERYWIDVAAIAGQPPAGSSGASTVAAVLHPLLHSNTSDLSEQSYGSTFTGDEFFLADHQVAASGDSARPILPAVAYLEMARAAVERAVPAHPEAGVVELRDTVWAQPIVVSGNAHVSIAVIPTEGDQLEYEIFSDGDRDETVHCQGRAAFTTSPAPARVDLEQLAARMTAGAIEPESVYAACARMGLVHGSSFRSIAALRRGRDEALAELRMPSAVADGAGAFVLHPSIMDGALQAAIGLVEAPLGDAQPRLPFALSVLRIFVPCAPEMFAWVRRAGGRSSDDISEIDIDLCDAAGNVCAQMRGLTSRVMTPRVQETGSIEAIPVWEAAAVAGSTAAATDEWVERHVLVCELPNRVAVDLAALLPESRCMSLEAPPRATIADRYADHAVACLERIQAILRAKPRGQVLVQVVVPDEGERALLAGLSGLLKTAALESRQLAGQLALVPAETTAGELAASLRSEQAHPVEPVVRYTTHGRQIVRWREVAASSAPAPIAFRDDGVYVITGGLGALGTLFVREILEQTRAAHIIVTGRSPLTPDTQARLDALGAESGRVTYRQADLCDLDQTKRLIAEINYEHHQLNGVVHAAGMIADRLIVNKESSELRAVLAPKVAGTFNLDQATRIVDLDFFVLFSSLAGPLGNVGQADYAAANGFVDSFAAYRNGLVAARQRYGRTVSIDWPMWQAGGMAIDAARRELLQQATGIEPMQTATGMRAFHRALALDCDQMLVAEGDVARLRRALLAGGAVVDAGPVQPRIDATPAAGDLPAATRDHLRKELSSLLKMPSQKIDPYAALETYGIDSILALKLTAQLEKTFGPLSKTLFFEYQTIHELAEYFAANHAAKLTELLAPAATARPEAVPAPVVAPPKPERRRRFGRTAPAAPAPRTEAEPIAIIGLSGRYPEAIDLDAYWENLRQAKDCITEVPRERWDWREYFSSDRTRAGQHYSKWGGFIAGVDEFDPLFFSISPAEAELIDPQERLFLQHVWMAIEDAGYTRATLQVPATNDLAGQVGVYAGVMYNEYQLFAAEAEARGKRVPIPGSTASIANRVSYILNVHGPSVTLDTMCSSSLTAIHFACQDLALGRTSLAIAGGVNVSIHPNKYLVLSAGQFISSDGHCQSFGEGGDGYIPGEGVGVVVLKRLSNARRDGDHIYGVIRGSALNHGGKTNGYTVPNPQAQATAIGRALAESRIDPRHVSYIEAHGTGTTLGDPIEIAALTKAFRQSTPDNGFCLIGSAKSNIGHCESAAGIAGLTKVLLQMQHRELVPSLHSARLNPHIDFAATPFVVNQELRPWERPVVKGQQVPRIAGISSFGAGGSNAHLIVEEYEAEAPRAFGAAPVAILLSARTPEQLRQKAIDLSRFVRARVDADDLARVAYTLQVGREAMDERLAFIVASAEELTEKLNAFLAGGDAIGDAYRGSVTRGSDSLSLFSSDPDLQQTVEKWLANGKLANLLELWVRGLDPDWSMLWGEQKPGRISLPAYPFARERYWIDVAAAGQIATTRGAVAVLHPLLHTNASDLTEQRYRSTFTGEELFLSDHRVKVGGGAAVKVLPAVAHLEMARAAIEHAVPERPPSTFLELRNIVWAQPLAVPEPRDVQIALTASDDGEIEYEIYSVRDAEEIVHGQGRASWSAVPAPPHVDVDELVAHMTRTLEPDSVYAALAEMGLVYGPAFRSIRAIHRGSGELLVRLQVPRAAEETSAEYILHPSVTDGALHAAVGLLDDLTAAGNEPRLPFALDALRVIAPCEPEMVAWIRRSAGTSAADDVLELDIDLCDEHGNVCVAMRGFASRLLRSATELALSEETRGRLLAAPVWQASELAAHAGPARAVASDRHVLLCLEGVDVQRLASLLPRSECIIPAVSDGTIAERYTACAVACFEKLQAILRRIGETNALVQVVVGDAGEQALFAALSGLLRTAAQEHPRLVGQVILVPAGIADRELARLLDDESVRGADALVRYRDGAREVLQWQEITAEPEAPIAFDDRGVYLITGGSGGLGLLFAREILERTSDAHVILTGRSPLAGRKATLLNDLVAYGARVAYRQLDVTSLAEVETLVAEIQREHGRLNGVLHSAGMIADRLIARKSAAEFTEVLAPKVTGTFNLDHATRNVELDFFVLFSSVAGAAGNAGQADYAAANAFMDHFAAYRNARMAANERRGRTRSIDWPLWQSGGMRVDPAAEELMRRSTGMRAMQTAVGLQAFHVALDLPYDQLLVAEGDTARMRRALLAPADLPGAEEAPPQTVAAIDTEQLTVRVQDFLRNEFSPLLKLPFQKIDANAALEKYGIDSILAMRLTNQLEQTFGSLSKTLFFEYQTIAALSAYFIKAHPELVREKVGAVEEAAQPVARAVAATPAAAATRRPRKRSFTAAAPRRRDIAIVGVAGRYPQAETLSDFWKNLQNGRDCITEVPTDRWDHAIYFDADPNRPGKSYSKWGGFVADIDKFDPLFFNISPKEAAQIDPQERLFLQTAWETFEDAGYTKESISGSRVGVYVGVMWGQYELFGAESILGGSTAISSSSHGSIANRVSYFFDFHGPSIALDTMCSSSLTAIHLACDELRKGTIDAALAGGVNLTVHPYKYVSLSQGKFVATDGRCRSFGAGGDGYVPGEGVGAVLLKTLDDALRDGDQIYAVIRSSSVNHGGKTNGYSVPNPNAQAELIRDALSSAGIDPATLSYIETHGTGTALGDPIEITGLSKAFGESAAKKQFCPIGSVKSNIGHLESAAGIAALTKTLLQLRHKQLVPSLHAEPLNPNIDFAGSPFYVQRELAEWSRPAAHPRRAAVSSFGAGGSNAHLIVEEYDDARMASAGDPASPELFVLSARDVSALVRYAGRFAEYLADARGASLASIAYTSQIGRTSMDARLAIAASTVEELRTRLEEWIGLHGGAGAATSGARPEHVFYGYTRDGAENAANLIDGSAGKAFIDALLAGRDLEKLARLWVAGAAIDWSRMRRGATPARVSLPTYPFAKERCWIEQSRRAAPALLPSYPPLAAAEPAAEEKRTTYYYPRWTPRALAEAATASIPGPILILDDSDELFSAMSEQMGGGSLLLVKPADAFQQIGPDMYVVDPENSEHFVELIETLARQSRLPRVVLLNSSKPCDLEVEEDIARKLNGGVYALFGVCKALIGRTDVVAPRIVSLFSSAANATDPIAAAIGGFLRTFALENPRVVAKSIELEAELTASARAAIVRNELSEAQSTTTEIRYRRGARFERALEAGRARETASPSLPLRQHGVYLITGGFGGLGFVFAEHLATTFQAKLVLVGRSGAAPHHEEKLRALEARGAEVLALRADVSQLEDARRVVAAARERFGEIHGVLHAAGVTRDAFVPRKSADEIRDVLAPKVYGTINLDLATRQESLDWFVLFSSLAGVTGNRGQSDYAYANHFLDSFAELRESLRSAGLRSGRTLSIDWPLWADGGMSLSAEQRSALERQTGLSPLPAAEGIRCWEELLRSDATQVVPLYGVPSRIAARFAARPAQTEDRAPAPPPQTTDAALSARTETYLKALIGEETRLDPERIGSADRLESFGLDSVMINRLNATLERDLGALPKTLLYEHETVGEVTAFLMREARPRLVELLGPATAADDFAPAIDVEEPHIAPSPSPRRSDEPEAIAIIGLHGAYPHSPDAVAYWENLAAGRDLIDVVPPGRWDAEELYDSDPEAAADGRIYCKWGGLLDDYDKFDPRFFNISAEEATIIDPQERLFLQSVWAAIEDAGYTRDALRKRFGKGRGIDAGVFVGVTTNSYHLWAPEERARGSFVSPTAMPWSIANRVSYFFDFNGPSLPVDTACSSSLVAIHLACESLRGGDCRIAIAGGVNLYLHPSKYESLCQKRMLSADGKTRSYGAGGEGFVPGEGVGTVVLKRLGDAIADRDRIYAVIRASAFDHSGRSNGYSAPNPSSQAALIRQTLEKARIHPETIGYVEGHGTGTQLGDSLEIAALTQAFRKQTERRQFCPIGSVKANLGHSESAAGIAGLAKVILQMQHRTIAPTIHSEEINPNIDLDDSPFYLQHRAADWSPSPEHPRRALINSFGAGGVNACIVVEEYDDCGGTATADAGGPHLFVLSAKDESRLHEYAERMLTHLRSDASIDLASLCHTLQVGREAMEERLATVVRSAADLVERLAEWLRHGTAAYVHRGTTGARRGSKRPSKRIASAATEQELMELAASWAGGEEIDWERLDSGDAPRRVALPTYPFARERYWVSDIVVPESRARATPHLHPLIACNSSTLSDVGFSSRLSESAFYAVDHQVHARRIFPGAAFLEIACIAGNIAGEQRVRKITDIVWMHPLTFDNGAQSIRTVLRTSGGVVEYAMSSLDDELEPIVHSEGRLTFGNGAAVENGADQRLSLDALKARCSRFEDGTAYYAALREHGLHYGPAFRTIRELAVDGSFALARLRIAREVEREFGQYILHPSMIDAALQTAGSLMGAQSPATPHVPFALDEIEIVRPVPRTCYAYAEWADADANRRPGVAKFDVRLVNESGDVLVKMKNLYLRPLAPPPAADSRAAAARLLARPGGTAL